MTNRKRGRPKKGVPALSRDEVVDRTMRLVLDTGRPVGMREIARTLGVDPMALYHYFADKGELYEALVSRCIDDIYRPVPGSDWRVELHVLMTSYLDLLVRHRGLLETVLRLGSRAKGPAEIFRRRFETATGALGLSAADSFTAMSAAVDFVHGFVAALEYAEAGVLDAEDAQGSIAVIIDGIAALSRRATSTDE